MITTETLTHPFPGLRPFQEDESHLFFGREEQTDELMRRLKQHRFLAVVGTSGSGKSSLVRAGLLPSLYRGFMTQAGSRWQVAILRPGDRPIANLAAALSQTFADHSPLDDPDLHRMVTETTLRRGALGMVEVVQHNQMPTPTNLLVVVDQFEELFRFKQRAQGQDANPKFDNAAEETAAFVKLLLAAVQQEEVEIYVVITLRSDFLGDCAQFRDLPEAMNESQYLIPRMTREQKRRAIEGPVAVCQGKITPLLVNQLLNDVGDNPDQLPVLQHALMRTWEKWRSESDPHQAIDLQHYQAIGGMAQALSQHADEIYLGLPDDRARKIAEILFKALTEMGTDNRGIRRPTTLSQICAVAAAETQDVIAVVNAFRGPGKSFIMPPVGDALTGETVLDISHESLMRVWKELQKWVDQEAQSVQIYQRLADTARRFQAGTAPYLQDPELSIVKSWRNEIQPNEAWGKRYDPDFELAMQFLDESAISADKAERQRRRQRRWVLLVMGGATVFSSLVALFAVYQLQQAEFQRMRQYEVTAKLLTQTNPLEGLKNGIAAVGLGRSNFLKFPNLKQSDLVSEDILLQPSNQVLSKILRGHEASVGSVAFSPDGQSIVSGSSDQTVRLW
ncbi:NACHT and WD repeat domain-containing protein, partial [Lyngbya confervoides]